MYAVSRAFLEAMKRPVQHSRVRGTIKASAWNYLFTEANIQKGAFSLTNQCSDDDNVQIGTVYVGELSATFVNMAMQRYSLQDAVITPIYSLLTDNGWEDVPLGVFRINEANWTQWGVEIVAYDNMARFDKSLHIASTSGTLYDFMMLACRACGVECGMTEDEVSMLPNGDIVLATFPENDIETYRDLISWCAQTAGCFATMDRYGKLVFRRYGLDPVDEIDTYNRLTGAKFSDFETRYTGMSCVNIEEKTTTYYTYGYDDALTYNLGSNPLLQFGTEEVIQANRMAVLEALRVIEYVPCEVSMIGTPAYDLGDIIRFKDGIADGDRISCITKFEWTLNGEYHVTCVGQNPALASARSKTDKNISGLMSQTDEDAMKYYNYQNAAELEIRDGNSKEVIFFRYIATKATHIDFHAEIKFQIDTTEDESEDAYTENDAVVKVTYFVDDEEIMDYYPADTYQDGVYLMHLLRTWYSSSGLYTKFSVKIEMEGATMFIDRGDCHAYIAGQGLVGEEGWDGNVHIDQDFLRYNFRRAIKEMEGTAAGSTIIPTEGNMNQQFSRVNFRSMLKGISDSISSSALHRYSVPYNENDMTYDNATIDGNNWVVYDQSTNGIVTSPNREAQSILWATSACSSGVYFSASFDGGESWWAYNNGWSEMDTTQEIYGMSADTMASITSAQWADKLDGTIMIRAILVADATLTDIQIYTEVLV